MYILLLSWTGQVVVGSGLDGRWYYRPSSLQPFPPTSCNRTAITYWHLVPCAFAVASHYCQWHVLVPWLLTPRLYWLVLDSETVGMWGGYVRAIPREVREIGWTACWAVGSSGCPPFLASERQQQTEDWRLLLQRMQRLQKGMLGMGVGVGGGTFGDLKWEHQLDTRLLWSDCSRTNQFVSPVNILVPCSPIQMNGRCG